MMTIIMKRITLKEKQTIGRQVEVVFVCLFHSILTNQ